MACAPVPAAAAAAAAAAVDACWVLGRGFCRQHALRAWSGGAEKCGSAQAGRCDAGGGAGPAVVAGGPAAAPLLSASSPKRPPSQAAACPIAALALAFGRSRGANLLVLAGAGLLLSCCLSNLRRSKSMAARHLKRGSAKKQLCQGRRLGVRDRPPDVCAHKWSVGGRGACFAGSE